jgi:transketolase
MEDMSIALKVSSLEQGMEAQGLRIAERAEAVEKLAKAISEATSAENEATAKLLETKLTGVDTTLANSIEVHAKALELQAREYERRFGILDRGLELSVSNEVFNEVEKQRREENHTLRAWRDRVDAELNVQRGKNSERQSMIALAFSILSFVGMLVALFLAFGKAHP